MALEFLVRERAEQFFKKDITVPLYFPPRVEVRLIVVLYSFTHDTIIHPHRVRVKPARVYFVYTLIFCFAGRLSSTSIKKIQPKPSASHSVKGEPSTSVLMMAAVTGSAKL